MAITGEKIYEFTYIKFDDTMCPDQIKSYASTKLIHIESKHVAFLDNNTKIFFELSEKVNYGNTVLGIHRNATIQNEYFRIINMSKSICQRAVRFVISRDSRIWSDNTHWTLAYLIKQGMDVTIMNIPMYILDFRGEIPIIFDKNGAVFDSLHDIKSAIASAKRIQERIDKGWRPCNLSYKIINLYSDINNLLTKEGNLNVQS
jgi:hypothetical protein